MSRLFKPKISMPTPPPVQERVEYKPPTMQLPSETEAETTTPEPDIETQEAEMQIAKKKKGKKSTIMTSAQGLTTDADIYTPTLLG
jgi:hypothetical protein